MGSPDLNENATVFIGVDEEPVYEGRLTDALRYAVETVRESDRSHCYIMALSGDRYGFAIIDAVYASLRPTNPKP